MLLLATVILTVMVTIVAMTFWLIERQMTLWEERGRAVTAARREYGQAEERYIRATLAARGSR